jgi:hypothetical protein
MADTPMIDRATGDKTFGPIAAAFLSAGVGGVVLGILVVLAEASSGIKDALELNARVGPLSGKTIFAVVAWLVAWVVLHVVLKDKDPEPTKVFVWTGVLFAIAIVLTFPIFFQLFVAEE